MDNDITIKEITEKVEKASTNFEKTNTELKRKYLIWNIESFNIIASKVKGFRGTFGTGYPFYALDEKLEGKLPIIEEQIRYNRQLVKDGEPIQKSIWKCKECLEEKYAEMQNLKSVCKPCPKMLNELKPRKIINRLPDMDMWLVCEDEYVSQAQEELAELLEKINMHTSDIKPFSSINNVIKISEMLAKGILPKEFLPIDAHIIEYSKLKELIEKVPETLSAAKKEETAPYLPISPKSYRKTWQYDDEAYNFIYDYLSAFTSFSFDKELQEVLIKTRKKVIHENTPEELFDFLMKSATKANFRRFQSIELENIFIKRVTNWRNYEKDSKEKIKEDNNEEYII